MKVTPDKASYTPGGKAALNIETTDEAGKPVSAIVGLTVTGGGTVVKALRLPSRWPTRRWPLPVSPRSS